MYSAKVSLNLKVSADECAKNLFQGNGIVKAIKIAENLMKATAPGEFHNVPKGPLCNKENFDFNHRYWKQVFHILRKKK